MKKRQQSIGDRIQRITTVLGEDAANRYLDNGWRLWGTGVLVDVDPLDGSPIMGFTMVKLAPLPEDDEE